MSRALKIFWNRCHKDTWCNLYAVDVYDAHFNGLEGVYVLWHGGPQPETILVGQGQVRERILFHRSDPELALYKDKLVYVTWARVEKPFREGVQRYLLESMQPRLRGPENGNTIPIEVNLPGRTAEGESAPVTSSVSQPGQIWEELVAFGGENPTGLKAGEVAVAPPPPPVKAPPIQPPPAQVAAKPKRVLPLQKKFDDLVARLRQNSAKSGGFFGGPQSKAPEEEALVINAVQLIMEEALRMQASDIHLEPMEEGVRLRYRIDGLLEEMLLVSSKLNIRVVSRVRVMCGLDPEQNVVSAKPQDGRMRVTIDGQEADIRLSTFPTSYGDKAVLRIIRRNAKLPDMAQVGMSPASAEAVRQLIHRPQGMIVVTGPAGSGKSTTLYTMLQALNEPWRNIVTLEDPIELRIRGINQAAIQPKIGLTFAEGLRSILRQDPNVIMVGEIRDPETAEISMSAALTGHLLFSTLHTNNSLGAITRLLDMGLEPYLIASALTAVLAQRLARRLCERCREGHPISPEGRARIEDIVRRLGIRFPVESITQIYRAKGCPVCRESGYSGRVLLFEMVQLTSRLRELILQRAPMGELQKAAVQEGMEPLIIDGLRKMQAGWTTMEEVIRVAGIGE